MRGFRGGRAVQSVLLTRAGTREEEGATHKYETVSSGKSRGSKEEAACGKMASRHQKCDHLTKEALGVGKEESEVRTRVRRSSSKDRLPRGSKYLEEPSRGNLATDGTTVCGPFKDTQGRGQLGRAKGRQGTPRVGRTLYPSSSTTEYCSSWYFETTVWTI